LTGCSKPDNDELLSSDPDNVGTDPAKVEYDAKAAILPATKVPGLTEFCEYKNYNFIAGQHTDAGDIVVGNTKDSLFITMSVPDGFSNADENLKIYIGSTIFADRPSAGNLLPYKWKIASGVTIINIGFSLAELNLACNAAFYIVIHGDVPGGTAFGGDVEGPGNAWWFYINFTPKCCEPPTPPECSISANTVVTDVKCFGLSTGAINLTILNGLAPYSILWSNQATGEDLSGIPAGTYSVSVTDANKCVVSVTGIIVNQPAAAISATTAVTDISTFGAADGAIDLIVTGGTGPYTFLWDNGKTTEDLSALSPGTYKVTVKDANGCETTASAILNEIKCDLSASAITTNISVFGANDGKIDVTVSGGSGSYTFLWNNGAVTEDISGLAAGTYTLKITDAKGCIETVTGVVNEGPKPKGFNAFARKTFEPMVHCFMKLDMDKNGSPDFTGWGWTNGALPEAEGFTSRYELFINAGSCDIVNATKVGDMAVQYFNGKVTATITLLAGYTMDKTSLYIGNDMLPKDGGVYTIDPAKYPYQHNLGGATTDTFSVSASGSIYIIAYAHIMEGNGDN
jgi:hypothetical protein